MLKIRPVAEADLAEVAGYLHKNFRASRSAADFQQAFRHPWVYRGPNHGFLLEDGGRIVGVLLAIYCERMVRGKRLKVCNLTSWHVLPEYRSHSFKLALAVLGQKGLHFTNFTPNEPAVKIFTAFGFKDLDSARFVLPNLPWPFGDWEFSEEPSEVASRAEDPLRSELLDHAGIPGLGFISARGRFGNCFVLFRKGTRRRVPFMEVMHGGPPGPFRAALRAIAAKFFSRHRTAYTLVPRRFLRGTAPFPHLTIAGACREMYMSPALDPGDTDYLYSERMAFL